MPVDCYAEWKAAYLEESAQHVENMEAAVTKQERLDEIDRHVAAIQALRTAYETCVNGGGDA